MSECKSCGVKLEDHLGLQGTCKKLGELGTAYAVLAAKCAALQSAIATKDAALQEVLGWHQRDYYVPPWLQGVIRTALQAGKGEG